MFDRISVWQGERNPSDGALAYGREWAERLRCPCHAIDSLAGATAQPAAVGQRQERNGGAAVAVATAAPPSAETEGGELCVVGQSLAKELRGPLFSRSARPGSALLVCPNEWHATSRALVLNEDDGDESFLRTAARLCERLQSRAVVLSVARSDRDAARRGRQAAEVLGGFELDCAFDELIGLKTDAAVLHVAGWRRCQVVMLKRRPGRRWWPWPSSNTFELLTAHPSSLAVFALPEQS